MSFQVVFLPKARADIASAVAWMAHENTVAATRWRIGIFRIVERLEADPHRYALADESEDVGRQLRQLLYGKRPHVYRILYTIDGETV